MDHKPTVKITVRPSYSQQQADELANYDWEGKTKEEIEDEILDYIVGEGLLEFFSFGVEVK